MKKEVNHNSFNPFLQRQIQEQKKQRFSIKENSKSRCKE